MIGCPHFYPYLDSLKILEKKYELEIDKCKVSKKSKNGINSNEHITLFLRIKNDKITDIEFSIVSF